MNTFADHLYDLRRSARLTQKQLADRIGVNRAIYAMYETGKLTPAPHTPEAICTECAAAPDTLRTLAEEADL